MEEQKNINQANRMNSKQSAPVDSTMQGNFSLQLRE
jgi:hypothetical protein